MVKPKKKTVKHYDFYELLHYIEKKYNIDTQDYYKKHSSSPGVWKSDDSRPYANFWHYIIHVNENVRNGCYIQLPEDLPWGEVMDDPQCYDKLGIHVATPKFVMEIIDLLKKEFGDDIVEQDLWVEW